MLVLKFNIYFYNYISNFKGQLIFIIIGIFSRQLIEYCFHFVLYRFKYSSSNTVSTI